MSCSCTPGWVPVDIPRELSGSPYSVVLHCIPPLLVLRSCQAEGANPSAFGARDPRRLLIFDLKGMGMHRYMETLRSSNHTPKALKIHLPRSDARRENIDVPLAKEKARLCLSREGSHVHSLRSHRNPRRASCIRVHRLSPVKRLPYLLKDVFSTGAAVVAMRLDPRLISLQDGSMIIGKAQIATTADTFLPDKFPSAGEVGCQGGTRRSDTQLWSRLGIKSGRAGGRDDNMYQTSKVSVGRSEDKGITLAAEQIVAQSTACTLCTCTAREGAKGKTSPSGINRCASGKLTCRPASRYTDAEGKISCKDIRDKRVSSFDRCAKQKRSERRPLALHESAPCDWRTAVSQGLGFRVQHTLPAGRCSLHSPTPVRRAAIERHTRTLAASAPWAFRRASVNAFIAPVCARFCQDWNLKNTPVPVFWDQNFRDFVRGFPLCLEAADHFRLRAALENDTFLLQELGVVDYSLLLLVDENSSHLLPTRQLAVGLIDFFQPYTWDKQVENIGKSLAYITRGRRQRPTVLSPSDYRRRFLDTMKAFFSSAYPSDYSRLTRYLSFVLMQCRTSILARDAAPAFDYFKGHVRADVDEPVHRANVQYKQERPWRRSHAVWSGKGSTDLIGGLPVSEGRAVQRRVAQNCSVGQETPQSTVDCSHVFANELVNRRMEFRRSNKGWKGLSKEQSCINLLNHHGKGSGGGLEREEAHPEMPWRRGVSAILCAEGNNEKSRKVNGEWGGVVPTDGIVIPVGGVRADIETRLSKFCRVRSEEAQDAHVKSLKTYSMTKRVSNIRRSAFCPSSYSALPHGIPHSSTAGCEDVWRRGRWEASEISPVRVTLATFVAATRIRLVKLRVEKQELQERGLAL